jgi:serine/threonine protein phosphatase PrpC
MNALLKEIMEIELSSEHLILIIASDGVWEYVSDEEALKCV